MKSIIAHLICISIALPALAAVTAYTDPVAFEDALGAGAYLTAYEGFEDDATWGHVRTTVVDGPHTAPSVHSAFVTWEANNPLGGVTTGHGPAYFGDWGFFQLPHGDPDSGITDGWIIRTDPGDPRYAVGGWFETNTYGARMVFVIDGTTVVDFEDHPLDYAHQFYGVIVDEGFETLEVVETEATPGDEWYYIFADHFTIAVDRETRAPGATPPAVRLLPNVPNPFNPSTAIGFELASAGRVELRVYDVAGRLVRSLLDHAWRDAGRHRAQWDGRDTGGRGLPAGAYRCELVADGERASRWITLVK